MEAEILQRLADIPAGQPEDFDVERYFSMQAFRLVEARRCELVEMLVEDMVDRGSVIDRFVPLVSSDYDPPAEQSLANAIGEYCLRETVYGLDIDANGNVDAADDDYRGACRELIEEAVKEMVRDAQALLSEGEGYSSVIELSRQAAQRLKAENKDLRLDVSTAMGTSAAEAAFLMLHGRHMNIFGLDVELGSADEADVAVRWMLCARSTDPRSGLGTMTVSVETAPAKLQDTLVEDKVLASRLYGGGARLAGVMPEMLKAGWKKAFAILERSESPKARRNALPQPEEIDAAFARLERESGEQEETCYKPGMTLPEIEAVVSRRYPVAAQFYRIMTKEGPAAVIAGLLGASRLEKADGSPLLPDLLQHALPGRGYLRGQEVHSETMSP